MKIYSNNTSIISVIVSTYNWPEALGLVLGALQAQTDNNFEVLVVDDGSTDATKYMIDNFQKNLGGQLKFKLTHLWQEDNGFRLSRARNMGIQAAVGDYIIFLDGDCVVTPNFVARHRYLSEKNYFVTGNRVLLNKSFSEIVLQQRRPIWEYSAIFWLKSFLYRSCNKIMPLLYVRLNIFRYNKKNKISGVRGCNISFWREDLLKVKGFDESYQGWGYEDSDLVVRLMAANISRKSGKFATEVFHLWHPEAERSNQNVNYKKLIDIINNTDILPKQSLLLQRISQGV